MPIPEQCQKDIYPFLCTYMYFLKLGFSEEKADRIALYAFGHYVSIYS